MTEHNKEKMSRIVVRIQSQIGQLYGNMAYGDDDDGVDDAIVFDIAKLVSRDANTALELCNTTYDGGQVAVSFQNNKNEKMRLAVDRIWNNADDLNDELGTDNDIDIDIDVVVHLLNSIVRDVNILLNFSKHEK